MVCKAMRRKSHLRRKHKERRTEPWGPSAVRNGEEQIRKNQSDIAPALKKFTVLWHNKPRISSSVLWELRGS